MKTYLLKLWDDIRSSYWFIPLMMVLCSIIMSIGLPLFDQIYEEQNLKAWVKTSVGSARITLSTIIGAMIAVTGTVFSITIVTLSLASQQFGPRLLRTFMLDRVTQITLGLFLSTALYSTLVLRLIEKQDQGPVVLHFSVLFSVFLMIISVLMLVIYIHHVAVLIQASTIVFHVSRDLDSAIVRLFPDSIRDTNDEVEKRSIEDGFEAVDGQTICSLKEGYIQGFDEESILSLAVSEDIVIRLHGRPGDFIEKGARLAEVYGADDIETMTVPLNQGLIVGVRRTPRQDVECAIDELVEIAIRSLSPGINDPFTAITCVDRLGASLGRLVSRRMPSAYRFDDEGQLRLIVIPMKFSSILDASFHQIRQYASGSVAVLIRMLEMLHQIALRECRRDDKEALKRHADMIFRLSEQLTEPHDKEDITCRYAKIVQCLECDKQTHEVPISSANSSSVKL